MEISPRSGERCFLYHPHGPEFGYNRNNHRVVTYEMLQLLAEVCDPFWAMDNYISKKLYSDS